MEMTATRLEPVDKIAEQLAGGDTRLLERFRAVRAFSRQIRTSEYHLTNACNIRCKGCWFFVFEYDKKTKEDKSLEHLGEFVARERARKINTALLIGGEPTLFPERIRVFVDGMKYVTISTNGVKKLPADGFERVAIYVTLFGGGPLDDELRGIRPNGSRFTGVFDTALGHYAGDPRVTFIYAITSPGIGYIMETVRRIEDNGNKVNFNFYSEYDTDHPLRRDDEARLLEEALRVKAACPDTVIGHPYFLAAIATGKTEFGRFGYEVCPSISWDYAGHRERIERGAPTLPLFNTYAADLDTINFCCTSGHCESCRDSQAVSSWLLVSVREFLRSREGLRTWVDVAESYWRQLVWSPYRNPPASPSPPGAVEALTGARSA
jgi:hypothetical protein